MKWSLNCFDCRLAGDLGIVRLAGKLRPVSEIGLQMIRALVDNPSGVCLAKALRLMSFTVSVLAKEVGRSGFEVSVSSAPKFRGRDDLG